MRFGLSGYKDVRMTIGYKIGKAALITAAAFLLSPLSAQAEPKITTTVDYYLVTGATGRALKDQMKERGPKNLWGYTKWKVRWNRDCKVSVSIRYVLPLLNSRDLLSDTRLADWRKMRAALIRHENGHGQHGINAAREIEAAECKGGKAITKKWSTQGAVYDAETRHGRSEGVILPD